MSSCAELAMDWEGLPWLMMAAREAVHESRGFSSNDLALGHSVVVIVGMEPAKNVINSNTLFDCCWFNG